MIKWYPKNYGQTILYADDTNVIGISTKYNDLHQTVNATLQIISEWFKKRLVLNKNKTFAINSSWLKTPTYTLNIILGNQNLTLAKKLSSWVGTKYQFIMDIQQYSV